MKLYVGYGHIVNGPDKALRHIMRGGINVMELDYTIGGRVNDFVIVSSGVEFLEYLTELVEAGQLPAKKLPRIVAPQLTCAAEMAEAVLRLEKAAKTESYLRGLAEALGYTIEWKHIRKGSNHYDDELYTAENVALKLGQIKQHRKGGCGAWLAESFTFCQLYAADPEFGEAVAEGDRLSAQPFLICRPRRNRSGQLSDSLSFVSVKLPNSSSRQEAAVGFAFCGPGDNFSRAEGRRLSLQRALGE